MSIIRTSDDIGVVDGGIRALEWFWALDGTMPGLDDFERLERPSRIDRDISALGRPATRKARVRITHQRGTRKSEDPWRRQAHRFTMFHAGNDVWIIHRYYPKAKKKLDKVGRAVIRTTVLASIDYEERVKNGTYYGRG